MSSSTAAVRMQATIREILTALEAPAATNEAGRTLEFGSYNLSSTLNASSTPALEAPPSSQEITITAGTTTLDFTALALARNVSETYDYTGKKVIGAIFKTDPANAGAVTIAPGSSNPYPLFGSGNEKDIGPGRMDMFFFDTVGSNLAAVSGTAKTIDLTGTEDDIITVVLLFGT